MQNLQKLKKMRKLHIIDSYDRMGGEVYYRHADKYAHDPELREAYECGYKHGRKETYKEIMEEQYGGGYHERRDWREMPPMMRENDRYMDGRPDYRQDGYDDPYNERRGRDGMGRYIRR